MWTTKDTGRDCNYVVIKHSLPNINQIVMGVKFRQSFGVVEKDSKIYKQLKKFPFLKNAPEFPITFLKKLPFISRAADIQTVYGIDVYNKYIKAIALETAKQLKEEADKLIAEKLKKEAIHLSEESPKCRYRHEVGDYYKQLCTGDYIPGSPSKYCARHILKDKLLDLPPMPIMDKDKKKLAEQVAKNIEAYIKKD